MISSWLLQQALIKKEICLPSTKWDECGLQRSIQSAKVTTVQRVRPLQPAPVPRPSHPLALSPILSLCHPSSPPSHLRHPSGFPPPALAAPSPACPGRHFLRCWELHCCPYLFGSLFSKCWRWPHGVVFVTSLLLPFIITERWSPCVFLSVV